MATPEFPKKAYQMLNESENSDIVRWSVDGTSFAVLKLTEFCNELLPKYFKHNNYSSFVRQLNMYDFKKVGGSGSNTFSHPAFLRGRPALLANVVRKKRKDNARRASSADGSESDGATSTASSHGGGVSKQRTIVTQEIDETATEIEQVKAELAAQREMYQRSAMGLNEENKNLWRELRGIQSRGATMQTTARSMMQFLAYVLKAHPNQLQHAGAQQVTMAGEPAPSVSTTLANLPPRVTAPGSPTMGVELSSLPDAIHELGGDGGGDVMPVIPPTPTSASWPSGWGNANFADATFDFPSDSRDALLQSLLSNTQAAETLDPYLQEAFEAQTGDETILPPAKRHRPNTPPLFASSTHNAGTTIQDMPNAPHGAAAPTYDHTAAGQAPRVEEPTGESPRPATFAAPPPRPMTPNETSQHNMHVAQLTKQLLRGMAQMLRNHGPTQHLQPALLQEIADDRYKYIAEQQQGNPLAVLLAVIGWVGGYLRSPNPI